MNNNKLVISVFIFLTALVARAQTLKDAIHLTDNEQYDAAAVMFRDISKVELTNGTNYFYFGENYLLSDNPDSAIMMYEKGNALDPNNALNAIGKVKYNLNKSNKADINEANAMIDAALTKAGSKNALAYMEAADALIKFKTKNLDKAKTLLDKAAALDPKNPEIQILYGDIYSELNNGTLAADYYNKAIELDKNSVKAIVSKGRLYKRSTNYDGAAEEFQNAIKIDASFAPAHRELGEAFFKLGKLEKAKEEYRKYLELSKNNCAARVRYASFLYLSKDYPGAIGEINQLKQNCDPDNLTLLRVASYCYYETKDYTKGLAVIQRLFSKLTPEKIIALDYEYYGKTLAANNQDSLGIIQLRKAFEMDNNRCDLLTEIWKSYDKMKKNAEAAAVLLEKIQKCPGATAVDYFNLGRSYFYNSEFQKADTAFAKLNEISPKYASGYLWRAKANSQLDTTSENGLAKPFYEKYIEVATADTAGMANGKYKQSIIEAYRYLAYYFAIKNDNNNILNYLKKILEQDPNDKPALKGIDDLEKLKQQQQQKKKPQ